MSKTNWKFRWRRPSKFGWVVRIGVLVIALFIWINSARAKWGMGSAWGGLDPNTTTFLHSAQSIPTPWMVFTWRHFCLNLNGVPAFLPHGMPFKYATYVLIEAREDVPDTWQVFRYGFMMPVWAISVMGFALVAFAWRPRIFRIRPGFCSSCNYNLHGLNSATACPECGTVASPGS